MQIEETNLPHPGAEALLRRVIWGTPGGVRYQVLEPLDVEAIGEHRLFVARDAAEVVGTVVVTRHPLGWLRQLLAVAPERVGTGVGRALVDHVAGLPLDGPTHGTVEATNSRSLQLVARHYAHRRQLEVLSFTRRWPTRSGAGRQDLDAWLKGLPSAGRTGEPCSALPDHAFVIERDGRRAGVLCVPHRWRLHRLPGIQQGLLPLLGPLVGTTADDYRFGMFHCWWGPVDLYDELWSHALAEQGLTTALAVGDVECTLWHQVRRRVRRGLVGRLAGLQVMEVPSSVPLEGPLSFTPVHAL